MNEFQQSSTVDILHGISVADPYRSLENRESFETESWVRDQQQRLETYFSRISGLGSIEARVSSFLYSTNADQPARVGSRYFYRSRRGSQEQALICTRTHRMEDERVLVDPSHMGPFAAVAIHRISEDGSLLAYELRDGGSDAKAIRIVEVRDGHTLPDSLERGYIRGFHFSPDRTGFYYCRDSARTSGSGSIHFHQWGNNQTQDEMLFQVGRSSTGRIGLLADDLCLGAIVTGFDGSACSTNLYISRHSDRSNWKPAFIGKRSVHQIFLQRGRVFVLTTEGTSGKSLIEVSHAGETVRVIISESNPEISKVAMIGDLFFVTYLSRLRPYIRIYTSTGTDAGSIELPGDGSLDVLPIISSGSTSLFYSGESFLGAPKIFEYLPLTGETSLWFTSDYKLPQDGFAVEQVTYRAADDRSIPMFLMMRRDLDRDRANPLILTSYGGFGTSMTPRFSILVSIMVELGAIFALPIIRGGSEFGTTWHEAARGRNRHVAILDFLSSAEWLCDQGVTAPGKLGIFGGSNSGLLVGSAMTQRPGLFGAVLCIAPLLDMIRYEQFDSARKWQHEYGSVDNRDDFLALLRYSPYHQIDPDRNYPATLFVTGDMDDRCNPAHVRKMAAFLQNRDSQLNPILVDYSIVRGHTPALPLSVRVEALTRRIAFLAHELGMKVHEVTSDESVAL